MKNIVRAASVLAVVAGGLGTASAAHATYFVRPVLQYEGSTQDGLRINGPTSGRQTFYGGGTALEASVDLTTGEILLYNERYGPSDSYTIASGVIGDQIRYTGAEDVAVDFYFDFHSEIWADQSFVDDPLDSRYIGLQAYFAVYEAGSGAYYNDWTSYGSFADQALYVDTEFMSFQDFGENFYEDYYGTLGTSLFLNSGQSYDVFAAFNLIVTPGSMPGTIVMDGLNTGQIGISSPGGSFTSESGQFLGFGPTPASPGAVPEPASWALMLIGFFGVGGAMRTRKQRQTLNFA